jgi:mono/diheme cytochrome c family protein
VSNSNKYFIAGIIVCIFSIAVVLYVTQTKKDYYLVRGKKSYEKHCANCHGKNGEGLQLLIPPLTDAAWIQPDSIVCIIRHGLDGKILVNGTTYSGRMPANLKIEEDEIADLVSYLRHEIVHQPKKMSIGDVKNQNLNCR